MSQDAEILKKQSFRQNIHHVVRLVKLIHSLDHSFYVWNFCYNESGYYLWSASSFFLCD